MLSYIHVTTTRIKVVVRVEGENTQQPLLSKEGWSTVMRKARAKSGEF